MSGMVLLATDSMFLVTRGGTSARRPWTFGSSPIIKAAERRILAAFGSGCASQRLLSASSQDCQAGLSLLAWCCLVGQQMAKAI
jgi:hypothetical protein